MSSQQDFKGVVSLSEEQYTTLSTTGTLTVGDITLTYSPTDTIYVTPDTSGGVIQLVGTETNPINLATDMEVGQIYSCTGVIYGGASIKNRILEEGISFLIEKMGANRVVIFNAKLGSPNIEFDHTNNLLIVYSSDGAISSFSSAIFFNSVNGKGISNNVTGIYAPTASGTSGQILQSNGSGNAPTWIDVPSNGIETLIGTTENPINFATSMKIGKLYSCQGVFNTTNEITDTSSIGYNKIINIGRISYNYYYLIYKAANNQIVILNTNVNTTNSSSQVQIMSSYYAHVRMNFDTTTGNITSLDQGMMLQNINGNLANLTAQREGIWVAEEAGTEGQILKSNGVNKAPSWIDLPSNSNCIRLTGTETDPIDILTDIEAGNLYLCSGYIHLSKQSTTAIDLSTNYILIYMQNDAPAGGFTLIRILDTIFEDNSTGGSFSIYTGVNTTVRILNNTISGYLYSVAPSSINGETTTKDGIFAPTEGGTSGQILQSNGNAEPTWIDMPSGSSGIIQLTGTAESPINLATSLTTGQLYSCKGVINAGANYSFTSLGETNDNFLLYKWSDTGIYALTCSSSGIDGVTHIFNGYQGICYIIIDTSGNITGVSNANFINSLNGNSNVEPGTPLSIYAPTTSGEAGQFLQSNGADQAPSWNSLSTTISESSTDNEIPSALAVYNLIQSSIVSALGGNY